MSIIKAFIYFDKKFWVGVFERTDKEGYAAARHIFGGEPSDSEIYEFILERYQELKFGELKEVKIQIERMNPKRAQREVRQEMEKIKATTRPSTIAQDYMREELEKYKKEKRTLTNAMKEARKQEQFALKQQKKKEKHLGR